jgi:hypothetical protein
MTAVWMIKVSATINSPEEGDTRTESLHYGIQKVILENVANKFVALSVNGFRQNRVWHWWNRNEILSDLKKLGEDFFTSEKEFLSPEMKEMLQKIYNSDYVNSDDMLVWVDDICFDADADLLSRLANRQNIIRDVYSAAFAVIIEIEFPEYMPHPQNLSNYMEWIKRRQGKPSTTSEEATAGQDSEFTTVSSLKALESDDLWTELDPIFAIGEWTSMWTAFPVVVSKQVFLSISKHIISWSDFTRYITVVEGVISHRVPPGHHYFRNCVNRVREMNSWREEHIHGTRKLPFSQWIHRARNYEIHYTPNLIYIVLGLVDRSYYESWALTEPCPKSSSRSRYESWELTEPSSWSFPDYRKRKSIEIPNEFLYRATAAIILHDKSMFHLLSRPRQKKQTQDNLYQSTPSWVIGCFLRTNMSQSTLQFEQWDMEETLFENSSYSNDMFKAEPKHKSKKKSSWQLDLWSYEPLEERDTTYSTIRLPAIEIDRVSDSLLPIMTERDILKNDLKQHGMLLELLEQVGFDLTQVRETLTIYDSFSPDERVAFILETLEDPLNGFYDKEYAPTGEPLISVCMEIMGRRPQSWALGRMGRESEEVGLELKEAKPKRGFLSYRNENPNMTEAHGRTMFRTTKGYLGWMDSQIEQREFRLFRLSGFPLPVILEHAFGQRYRYVGYAYLHGFMPEQKVQLTDMKVETVMLV